MNVRFICPECQTPGYSELPAVDPWQCTRCDHFVDFHNADADGLHACAICQNRELYKKKDFPHWLGLTILTAACLGSIIPYWLYLQWLTWTILIGSAVFDGLLYLWVGDVVVCYRCNAHFRQCTVLPEHKPHELVIAEKYRQERIRREQLQATRRAR